MVFLATHSNKTIFLVGMINIEDLSNHEIRNYPRRNMKWKFIDYKILIIIYVLQYSKMQRCAYFTIYNFVKWFIFHTCQKCIKFYLCNKVWNVLLYCFVIFDFTSWCIDCWSCFYYILCWTSNNQISWLTQSPWIFE